MNTPKKKRFSPYLYQYQIDWCNEQIVDSSEYLRKLIDNDIKTKKGLRHLEELQEQEKERYVVYKKRT